MITITDAKVEDAYELLNTKIKAFEDEVKLYGFGPPGYDSIENQIKSIINGHYYKIIDNFIIIGGISAFEIGSAQFRIGSVFINPDYQNKGIGSKAITHLLKEFPYIKKWSLETPHLSFRNHHFYEKMGFIKVGETAFESNGFYLFLYEYTL